MTEDQAEKSLEKLLDENRKYWLPVSSYNRSPDEHDIVGKIRKIEVVEIRPGDRLFVTVDDGAILSRSHSESMVAFLEAKFPGVDVVILQGCEIKVVRRGGSEAETDSAEGATGEPGQTGAE